MRTQLSNERVRALMSSGESIDLLVRSPHGPATPRSGATLVEVDGDVVTFRHRDGQLERAHLDDVMDAAVVRRRLSGSGPFSKVIDAISWLR